ncbi:TPA: hypothetical protein ACSG6E_001963 [Escherichia coli]
MASWEESTGMTSPQLNSLNNNGEMPTPKADTLADFRCFVTQTDPESRRSAWRENASDTSWSDRLLTGKGRYSRKTNRLSRFSLHVSRPAASLDTHHFYFTVSFCCCGTLSGMWFNVSGIFASYMVLQATEKNREGGR